MDYTEEASMLIKQTALPENLAVFTPQLKSSMEQLIPKMMTLESKHEIFIILLRFALMYSDQTYLKHKINVYDEIIKMLKSKKPKFEVQ